MTNRVGRPRKYENQDTKHEGFSIPVDLRSMIIYESSRLGISKSEFVINALYSMNTDFVSEMITTQKELKETIENYSQVNKQQQQQLSKLVDKLNSSNLYNKVSLDDRLKKYFIDNKTRISKVSKTMKKNEIINNILLGYRKFIYKEYNEDVNIAEIKKQIEIILVGHGYIKGVI